MVISRAVTGVLFATVTCGAMIALPDSAYAATFKVNSRVDAKDSKLGDGICKAAGLGCTLRAAIEESNAIFGFPPDNIVLPSGTYKLTLGELVIIDSLSLRGNGLLYTKIDGNAMSRVLSVGPTGTNPIVQISRVTIQNGNGGSFINGGGIFIGSGSYLYLTDSSVLGNKSRQFGGGISNAGFLQLSRSKVSQNQVPLATAGGRTAAGGGIFNFSDSTLKIDSSTIRDNLAVRGGGISNGGGKLDITNSTITGNKASRRGGGIMTNGVANISYSTITANEANANLGTTGDEAAFGGGIYSDSGTVNIGNSILAKNQDNRSRFDSNYSPDCFSEPPENSVLPGRFITSFRGNLVGVTNSNCILCDNFYGTDISFDQVGTAASPLDPLLAPVTNNGGPTGTHAPLSNSPAIDKGNGVSSANLFDCPSIDQRGASRPFDGNGDGSAVCDVGAFEFGASITTP